MTFVSIRDFSHGMSRYLKKIKLGERVVITDHNVPVADIVPHQNTPLVPGWKRPIKKIKLKGESLSESIIKARQEERG